MKPITLALMIFLLAAPLALAQTQPGAKTGPGVVYQYSPKYKKKPPAEDNLLMPGGTYTVSFAGSPEGKPGQAILRLTSPVSINGCVNIINPPVKEIRNGPNMTYEIGQADIALDKTKRYAHYECKQGPHYAQADIILDPAFLKEENINQITLKSAGPSDVFDIQISDKNLTLIPRTSRAFKPHYTSAGKDPLSFRFE